MERTHIFYIIKIKINANVLINKRMKLIYKMKVKIFVIN